MGFVGRAISANLWGVAITFAASGDVRAQECVTFSTDSVVEEVCATISFPTGSIERGPGDQVRVASALWENRTTRTMTFTLEAGGALVASGGYFATVAPGQQMDTNVVLLQVDDDAAIGSTEVIEIGWGARGRLDGAPLYEASNSRSISLLIGPDRDGDGLVDAWETVGYDPNDDGTIELDLPGMGADPDHKDLFFEVDWMPGHEPRRFDLQAIKEAFAAAPVDVGGVPNPDGNPGISIWFDVGSLADGSASEDGAGANSCGDGVDNGGGDGIDGDDPDCLVGDDFDRRVYNAAWTGGNEVPLSSIDNLDSDDNGNGTADFYEVRGANFDTLRRLVFRYHLSAAPPTTPSGGWGEVGGNDSIEYNHDPGSRMHELGHNLNLQHGGFEDANCKTSYVSIMNYDHQFGIRRNSGYTGQDLDGDGTEDGRIIDFAPPRFPGGRGGALASLVEDNLDEATILDPTDPANQTAFTNANGLKTRSALDTGNNYNDDNPPDTTDAGLMVNIDTSDTNTGRPGACTNGDVSDEAQLWYNDWASISLPFNHFGDSASGAINPVLEPEPPLAELFELERTFNTTDLALGKGAVPAVVEAGSRFAYRLEVANQGPNPAEVVRIVDTLPSEVSVASGPAGCAETSPGTVDCELPTLEAGASRAVLLTVDTSGSCQGGVPVELVNTAVVSNASRMAGPDLDTSNDEARHAVTPVDTTPPEIACNAPATIDPTQALDEDEPDAAPTSFTATATDVCDAEVAASILAFDCFRLTRNGRRVDKTESCIVSFEGDTLLVSDSGGVGNRIVWRVTATDDSGNTSEVECGVDVVRKS